MGYGVEMERNGERLEFSLGRVTCIRIRRVYSAELNVHGFL